tara:strand:- start:249 stop:1250 length:1002 start_codon:yes stop_codon:yes gene_type:complete
MNNTSLSLSEIYSLAKTTLLHNGCDEANASILADTIMRAERDGSLSHGLFRLPSYVASLKSKKVKGNSKPSLEKITSSIIRADGDSGFAPMVLNLGLPAIIELTKENGVGILAIKNSHHMAALWPETEAIAEQGLVGFACTSYKPMVAPSGATEALFGTNPISFAWPRLGKNPVVYDMATASMAMGEVMVASREGHSVPLGTGLNKEGKQTEDPSEIVNGGVLLPFGGYKGSAIALMVELLAGALLGEWFSFEAEKYDNNDGGPPKGGEFILAMSPQIIAGDGWENHAEIFFKKMESLKGVRIPGNRRHLNRLDKGPRNINSKLLEKIDSLLK